MKQLLLSFLLMAFGQYGLAQSFVNGKVLDSKNQEPLAFVNILLDDGNSGISTDIDGKFRLDSKNFQSLTFSYIGYKKLTISKDVLAQEGYKVLLERNDYKLNEVVILPGVNPAHRIIDLAIENRKINNPELASDFSYESYNKLVFTVKLDSAITNNPDSFAALDSSELEGYNFTKKQDLMMMESVSERNHIPPTHSKEVIKASRISGFQNPIFSLIGTQLQSFSLYTPYIQLFGVSYLSPISKGSTSKYLFILKDTIYQGSDTVFRIQFQPKKGKYFDGLKGFLSINTDGYAVQNFVAETFDKQEDVGIKIQQKYKKVENRQWFPVQLNTFLNFESVDIGKFKMLGIGKSYLKNIQLQSNLSKKEIGNTVLKMEEGAGKKGDDFLNKYRVDSLSDRETRTYHVMDSIGKEANLDRIFTVYQTIFKGSFPLGPTDILLNRIIDYNGYEGFRLGLGAETNDKILKHFRVGGYGAYGFKDKAWKYGGHLRWIPKSNRQFEIKTTYINDVVESGGTNFFSDKLNPFSSETLKKLFIKQMDKVEKYQFEMSFQAMRDFQYTFFANRQFRTITSDYVFQDTKLGFESSSNQQFTATEAGVNVRWAFREKFVEMFGVKTPIKFDYPVVFAKYTHGFADLFDGNYDYNRYDLKITKKFRLRNLGITDLQVVSGYIDQALPITTLYRGDGSFDNRLRIAPDFSFQTIGPNEFYNDSYVSAFFKHSFKKLLFHYKWFEPELAIVSSVGFGSMRNQALHDNINFSTMDKGLFESGLQIDNLYENIGVGAYYRYGAYSFADFEDNIAIKVTFVSQF